MRKASPAIALLSVLGLAACGTDGTDGPGVDPRPDLTTTEVAQPTETVEPTDSPVGGFTIDDTTITYRFTDSSVPPENHRSFTLTIVDGIGTLVVDSYGDTLDTRAQPIDEAALDDLLTSYRDGELEEAFTPETVEPGCAGGTTVALTLTDGSTTDETSLYRCQANDEQARQLIEAMAPIVGHFDIADLTDGRYTVDS